MAANAIGVGFPDILAEVETNGFFIFSINLKQKGSLTIRIPKVESEAIKFEATFLGLSKIKVVGLSDKSIICQATSGISLKTLYIIFSPFIKQIIDWVSALCLSLYILATASEFVASQPIPHTVSVG